MRVILLGVISGSTAVAWAGFSVILVATLVVYNRNPVVKRVILMVSEPFMIASISFLIACEYATVV